LLARPFNIGDNVDLAGESDVIVKEIGALFTKVERRSDSNTVLIPSTMIIGQKIVIRKRI
ncbi:MAG: mechanosensitive ion channel family protein, partial [Candidatus Aenigmarchaeota archaeon]|nr:mechanosensitive ion channel [Candidatus Aenigmarchaeota archaeon]MDW8149311.1 mechanosensitive ion channel family protein [Candidatus Aenigmarchaeota archaeon]